MDTSNASNLLQQLGATNKIPIADLSPEISDSASRTVHGVVTITWPYNSVKDTFAFILAEPDYRLRRNKGQVRINLNGTSAKAVAESGLSSGDDVLLSLDGAEWEPEQVKKRQSLPGAGIDWQLKFSDKIVLQVTLAETGEANLVNVDRPPPKEPEPRAITPPPAEIVHEGVLPAQILETLTPPSKTYIAKLKDGEYESPAFVKRARMSYGSLFEDGYDIFEDDGGIRGRGRKRSRFGRESGAWRYTSQSPSPEPASPTNPASSSPRPDMTDEGCQTMEIDLPMPLAIREHEAQSVLESASRVEHAAHPQQGMVDHGVQGNFHDEWPVAVPSSLPPLGPSNGLPSSGPELPAFQTADGFNVAADDLQRWNDPHMNLPPEGYLHPTESPSVDGFANTFQAEKSTRPDMMRPENRIRSPNEPDHPDIERGEHHVNEDPATEEQGYQIQPASHSTDYPPLGLEDEEENTTMNQGAHIDYPPSYLDGNHPFSRDAMDIEQESFGPNIAATEDVGSMSWATVNNPSQATSIPQTGRRGSLEGDSPETAVVIDESDSDDEPPPPTAVEDTVMTGQADPVEMYEEADVEDEVDAEYSDDDEPEYDADEMGGDYDTRNYTAPDDDEDDSHDEDLRPHELEPEFEDGESWDEDDEDAENFEYEGEYESDDNDENQKPVQAIPQSAPQVIDLISSSEDEEDDDEVIQPQQAARPIPTNIPQSQPKTLEITSKQVFARATESESGGEGEVYEGEDDEEHTDDEDGESENEAEIEDANSVDLIDESESEPSDSEEDGEEVPEDELEEAALSPGDSDVAESIDTSAQHKSVVLETPLSNESTVHQEPSPELGNAVSKGIQDDEQTVDAEPNKEHDRSTPQSAAEGLEILSRVVENEASNENRIAPPEETKDEDALGATASKDNEPLVERVETPGARLEEHGMQNARDDGEMVDMVPNPSAAAPAPQPTTIDEEKRSEAIQPSSPPSSQSFILLSADEKKADVVSEETSIILGSRLAADQLPTPRDTQLTGDSAALESATSISMDIDEPDTANDEIEPRAISEQLTSENQPPEVEDVVMNAEEKPSSLSFETQIASDDTVPASFSEPMPDIVVEPKTRVDTQVDIGASISRASLSFISQMEIDEELQASIMENSEFDDDVEVEVLEEREIDYQVEEYEDEDDVRTEVGSQSIASREPSPELGTQIQEQGVEQRTPTDMEAGFPEQTSQADPSVQLARVAYTSKRKAKNDDAIKISQADEGSLSAARSSSPSVDDSSVQLARASITRSSQSEEESHSMTAAKLKLVRHLRDELPDCTALKVLRQHLQKKVDVVAVAMMHPPNPQRAKGGPREFMMSFTITDHSIGPYSVVEAQLYRPHKETLPIVKAGNIVLLRNFTVVSLQGKGFGLRTNDESSWAIFDHDSEPPQIKGPPVEYGEKETTYVTIMRTWYNLLDEKARSKLERANKKIIDAGRSKQG
ncbi:hypothetical protein F5Y11DRAFT_328954 [Daldinia sp. FL1419]|nr:hypothetical protein F5Y11DRAFT_328954 [Daldinia sp. FL1419]